MRRFPPILRYLTSTAPGPIIGPKPNPKSPCPPSTPITSHPSIEINPAASPLRLLTLHTTVTPPVKRGLAALGRPSQPLTKSLTPTRNLLTTKQTSKMSTVDTLRPQARNHPLLPTSSCAPVTASRTAKPTSPTSARAPTYSQISRTSSHHPQLHHDRRPASRSGPSWRTTVLPSRSEQTGAIGELTRQLYSSRQTRNLTSCEPPSCPSASPSVPRSQRRLRKSEQPG